MMMKRVFAVIGVLVLLGAAPVQANQYQDLLLQAIHSESGTASGPISGQAADAVRRAIGQPNAPVVATVTTLKALPQEGCKRMRITFTTPGNPVTALDGRTGELGLNVDVNFCASGMPSDDLSD